jgi:phospholipase/carboxylesterase
MWIFNDSWTDASIRDHKGRCGCGYCGKGIDRDPWQGRFTIRYALSLAEEFVDDRWHIAAPKAANGTWYPLSFMASPQQNAPWLESAIEVVHQLIDELAVIIPHDRIHIMGFSQGACLTCEAAARKAIRHGGIYAFTGGVIGDRPYPENYAGNFNGTPVYLSNSNNDPHVPLKRSQETKEIFQQMGAVVDLEIFPGRPHTITPKEIQQVRSMIASNA